MAVLIQNLQPRTIDSKALRTAVRTALQLEGAPARAEVSLVLGDDALLRRLNREYRQLDEPTDVLAFSQQEGEPEPGPSGGLLGDVVISVDTAERQAPAAGRTLDEEVAFLAVHGTLHLLGWDDETTEQRDRMLARQAEIEAAGRARA